MPRARGFAARVHREAAYLFTGMKAKLSRRDLDAVFEALRLGQGLELLQRVVLDLADALARDAERAADLLERARLPAGEAEAELDHLALALGQRVERGLDVLAPERELGRVVRRLG